MADEDLKRFLREQARSLDSLLELTPAKTMFGEDVSDQWQRKKQTPEQKKAARMAKLDPDNWKSAKDVYDERSAEAAKKRKREGQEEHQNFPAQQDVGTPSEQQPVKKRKTIDPTPKPTIVGKVGDLNDAEQIANKNLKKKMKKRANRLERNKEIREQKEQRKAERRAQASAPPADVVDEPQKGPERVSKKQSSSKDQSARILRPTPAKAKASKSTNPRKQSTKVVDAASTSKEVQSGSHEDDEEDIQESHESDAWSDVDEEISGFSNLNGIQDNESEDEVMHDADSTATSSEDTPDILSPAQDSAASSVSSILPPATKAHTKLASDAKIPPQADLKSGPLATSIQSESERAAARQRLQDQISQFRTQRKADDRPVRSRAELLEQRRRSEAEKKAAKKEQRKKQKEEEAKLQDEEMAKRFSPGGSGSLLASPRSPMIDIEGNDGFTFGRIAFEDGTQLDPTTLSAVAERKHKGASDPATALKAAQAKKARIAGLDDEKRLDIEEKDMWLNAKKRAHGERVKDDTSLLKKALKRQEKNKQRSGKDWDERIEGVRASQEAKQKKRTENLQKRKDEKTSKKGGKSSKSTGKKVKRPGFEGSFKGRAGKSTKKS